MASPYDIAALIEALKKLYSRIASLALQKRLSSGQRDNGTGAKPDIAAPLSRSIERLAASEQKGGQGAKADASLHEDPVVHETNPRRRQHAGRQPPKTTRRFKGLSRFLGRNKIGSALQPHVSQKLQASVWEHINTSLRLARRGEAKSAMLHADVANNALREAARYMSKEEYAEFCGQVEKKLGEIQALIEAPHPAGRDDVG